MKRKHICLSYDVLLRIIESAGRTFTRDYREQSGRPPRSIVAADFAECSVEIGDTVNFPFVDQDDPARFGNVC